MSQSGNLERLTFEREGTLVKRGDDRQISAAGLPESEVLQQSLNAQLGATTPEALLQAISLKPVLDRGQRTGFRVGASGADISQFGLQTGDIVTHIGSQDLRKGRPQIAKLISTFEQGQSVSISIIRDGQPQTIEVSR